MLFKELNLKQSSLKAIEELGFDTPTEIQQKSIPLLLDNDIDFVGQAQTGTGKTAAFTLPLLEKIDFRSPRIQALILAPTRELANQITEEINKLSKFEPVRAYTIYGGTSVSGQIRDVKRIKPQILVGTPGRTVDFLERGVLRVEDCKIVILDEADEMLDMGFFDDVQLILSQIEEKRIWMFSATMPKQIKDLIAKHFCSPEYVKVTKQILTSDSVDQQFCVVRESDQTEALCRYMDFQQNVYAIVFTKTKIGAKQLMDELNARGFEADSLHGDMSQDQRDCTMKRFKERKVKLLVCTDVAARGIDVNDLTHVVNYSLPQDNEAYVHRIGRTGRGGSKGVALSIITPPEVRRIRDIERITKATIERISLPNLSDIKEVLHNKVFESFAQAIESEVPNSALFNSLVEHFGDKSPEELLRGIYALAFKQTTKRYEGAPSTLDAKSRDRKSSAQTGYTKVSVNLGGVDGVEPGSLLRMISKSTPVKGADVGKIQIRDDMSYFEIPDTMVEKVLTLNGKNWFNQTLKVEVAGPGVSRAPRDGGRPPRRGARRNSREGSSGFRSGNPRRANGDRRRVRSEAYM